MRAERINQERTSSFKLKRTTDLRNNYVHLKCTTKCIKIYVKSDHNRQPDSTSVRRCFSTAEPFIPY